MYSAAHDSCDTIPRLTAGEDGSVRIWDSLLGTLERLRDLGNTVLVVDGDLVAFFDPVTRLPLPRNRQSLCQAISTGTAMAAVVKAVDRPITPWGRDNSRLMTARVSATLRAVLF